MGRLLALGSLVATVAASPPVHAERWSPHLGGSAEVSLVALTQLGSSEPDPLDQGGFGVAAAARLSITLAPRQPDGDWTGVRLEGGAMMASLAVGDLPLQDATLLFIPVAIGFQHGSGRREGGTWKGTVIGLSYQTGWTRLEIEERPATSSRWLLGSARLTVDVGAMREGHLHFALDVAPGWPRGPRMLIVAFGWAYL